MAITKFGLNEIVTRSNVNSRLSEVDTTVGTINDSISGVDSRITTLNNKFPMSIANGGTGGTTISGAVSNLKLIDTTEQNFTASTESAYITAVQNYFDNHYTTFVPLAYNAGWSGQGYGVAMGVRSGSSPDSRTLMLFNQKTGLKLYHKNASQTSWTDYSPTGVSLYDNSSGTSSTVALSVSSAKFDWIKIFFKDNNSDYSSITINSPDGKTTTLCSVGYYGGTSIYIKASAITISGASITWGNACEGQLRDSNTGRVYSGQKNSIIKVIGYGRKS